MDKLKRISFILGVGMVLMACGGQAGATEAATEDVLEVTSGPSPEIEIVSGFPDTCVMADETQSTVMGFFVVYRNVGTDSYMVAVMTAPEVGEIGGVGTAGEGRDGEENWGIYPYAYDLPPNTPITLEIVVYAGPDDSAPVSSTSSLTYDCTTGETIGAMFEGGS